ncbi:hypothetical protein M409DRAFT_67598 [Zasmidium cellare ATCC 36951]|uniref:tRNA wybutosine-synthesizing protein 4 n=1 Tax=Zasmidium cellare ATCC 36951 TaxID=1080233 RepID=A0A6A6CCG5_ZASCE|nr:uncharacterized protein M409DRAFT_67598 [Zasmidium cellare ATCC 36951]KAF2164887.1 hypothetical protein M409DRAFT_67598 [Zasmidium cellare ATCC 36951]
MAAAGEKADSPLPPILQLGLETTQYELPSRQQNLPLNIDTPVQNGDHSNSLNSGHENNSSSDKMLKAEKVLGLSSPNVKRSSSVPMLVRSSKETTVVDPQKHQRDELIMDTNKSSIVSKRSVEKLYYDGEPEYFRYFVSKFKRRSPLINRGYWLRMKAIEHAVSRFLSERTAKKKVVINLGCGYDPLPFLFLGKRPLLCQGTTFVDVDYPVLMQNKVGIIDKTEQLRHLLPKLTRTANDSGLLASSDPYVAIGCDLSSLIPLQEILQDHLQLGSGGVAILFVSEVSTAYMERDASQAVYEWAATYDDVRFCLLEQHLPDGADHPFAATMLSHFEKLRTPLRAIGTLEQMKARFAAAGFPEAGTEIRTLWDLWSDPGFLSAEERRALDRVEPFDEWEEFALFGSHYFLLMAEKEPGKDYNFKSFRATRASLFSGSTRGTSIASSPTNGGGNSSPDTPQYHFGPGDILQTHELLEPHNYRRFAHIVPPPETDAYGDSVGLYGGVGTQERLDSCNTFSRYDAIQPIQGPPLRTGLVCHAVTRLGSTANCVLTGGRTSPDKASAESWLRLDGKWRRVQDLPSGRYRHCAVPLVLPTEPRPAHTVLVFGGRTSDGRVLDEWLIWTGETGWQQVKVVGETPPARFGATMSTDGRESTSGVLVGGMTSAGRVLNDFWHWSLEHDMTLTCRNVTTRATAFLKADACILGRFGAQLVRSNRGILMVGGITGARMLTRQDEVLNLKTLRPQPIQGPRPLFIGHTLQDVDGGLLVLGGGATCFSFGTTWNRSCILNDMEPDKFDMEWRLQCTLEAGKPTAEQSTIFVESPSSNGTPALKMPDPVKIQDIRISHGVNFPQYVEAARPVILRKCKIGPCTTSWTNNYLKEAVGHDRKVAVHSSPSSEKMDFQKKNFQYITQDFGDFLDAVDRGERVYLRALSKDAPNNKPTSLAEDFPGIAPDFELPQELEYVTQNAHSSPLRISGQVQMWLHYDVMANVLCQVRGRKKILLFPPSDVSHLGFEPGASSSSIDVFAPEASTTHPSLANTHPHEALLDPGDILFIPPMWVHTVASSSSPTTSVAVNVFFRNLANGYAAGRDVYGNRDLAAYERGRKDVARIIKSFEELPAEVGGFYLERLGREMLERARVWSGKGDLHSVYAELS